MAIGISSWYLLFVVLIVLLFLPQWFQKMEFVDQKCFSEENQDQRYLNTVIMKYNIILLKISKFKQLDLARIKQLDSNCDFFMVGQIYFLACIHQQNRWFETLCSCTRIVSYIMIVLLVLVGNQQGNVSFSRLLHEILINVIVLCV